MTTKTDQELSCREVRIQTPRTIIKGDLCLPQNPKGIIVFAHGAGSSRFSARNRHVAAILQKAGFATLLMDLLSEEEEQLDIFTRKFRFDIPLLAGRVDNATEWIRSDDRTASLPIGYFGASTGAAAALIASIQRPKTVAAIVSRGGRPDLADNVLSEVQSPTLLIVGARDAAVLEQNQQALKKLNVEKKLVVIPDATHLFEEPGKLDKVAEHARRWFEKYIGSADCPTMHIDAWSFGRMTVGGDEYDEDLIIFPDKIKAHWWRQDGHILRTADLQDVLDYQPALLIVGTGASEHMQVEPAVKDTLRKKNITCIAAATGEAVGRFNEEIEKGTNVVGAFHLTC